MSMRTNAIVTHLRPEDAYTIVAFLDQLREVLMQNYGADIKAFLQEVTPPDPWIGEDDGEEF